MVIDAGRLLRHSSTASVTAETQLVTIEVDEGAAVLFERLRASGLDVRIDGQLLHVDVDDPTVHDRLLEAVAELGLGLVRLERERHRMTEIFTDSPSEQGSTHV